MEEIELPKRQATVRLHRAWEDPLPLRASVAKSRHIEVCLTEPVEYDKSPGFDAWEFQNEALPELALGEIDTAVTFAGKRLKAPLMISPMTGGNEQGLAINRTLASAAQRFGIAMGVGSQRIALENAEAAACFRVRDLAPDILLFANFGAAQLARGWGASQARRAVAMIGADALFIHFNAVQEAIQGGDRDFRGVTSALRDLCGELAGDGIPVYAREVCFGLSAQATHSLLQCGVQGIDCSGAGGTSWAKVEAFCARTPVRRETGLRFGEWGIPTARSIRNVRAVSETIPLIASGGLRSGIDLAKAIALGADLGAMARPMLLRAVQGGDALHAFIEDVLNDLRICMFATGTARVAALRGRVQPAGAPA